MGRSMYLRRIGILVIAASICACLGGCGAESIVNQEVALVDQLINKLNGNSLIWRTELGKIEKEALGQGMTDLANRLNDLLQNAVDTAGKVVQCSTAYVGYLVVNELQTVRADLLGKPEPVPVPMVCNTNPVELDPTNLTAKPETVTYYGFNLDPAHVREHLVHADGTTTDVSAQLVADSAFSDHIDLGGQNGLPISTKDARLDLATSTGTYSVTFNPPGVPTCQATQMPIVPPPATAEFYPPRVAGDADWGGNGPQVTITTTTVWSPHAITVLVSFDAQETNGGDTEVSMRDTPYTLYVPPPGYTILPPPAGLALTDSVTYTHTGAPVERPSQRGDQSLINSYEVDFGQGANAADDTALLVSFNDKQIPLLGPPSGSQSCSNEPPLPPTPPVAPKPVPPTVIPAPGSCRKPIVPQNWCD